MKSKIGTSMDDTKDLRKEKAMQTTQTYITHKKCFCCDRIYPPGTSQRYCDCERKGFLYPVSELYQPKVRKLYHLTNP